MQPSFLYALAGSLNSLLIVVSLPGLWSQLKKIWQRKHDASLGAGQATDILSLNQFSVSFLAYCAFFVYGYAHQIRLIWRSGRTGAVSLKMSQFILAMDVSTIFFACVMGLTTGWPLLLLACVSATTKLAIMWLFHWEKTSAAARMKRLAPA